MRMQRLYYEFDAEDRQVYSAWLRKTLAVLALILAVAVVVCTVLALDASTTLEQRTAPLQLSGALP
jgi:hypothetical protein